MVTAVPTAATSHHAGRRVVQARHAPASATALDRAIRLGFQMKVDSSTAAGEMAIASPATNPATGPAIERASHQVTPTAAMPGERDPGHHRERRVAAGQRHAAGARRK